jgi:hypothetical protein
VGYDGGGGSLAPFPLGKVGARGKGYRSPLGRR